MAQNEFGEYEIRRIPKKSGDFRLLCIPDAQTSSYQRLTLEAMYRRKLVDNPWALGGMPGVSLIDNVLPHAEGRSYYMLDAEDAFGNVDAEALVTYARELYDTGRGGEYDYSSFIEVFGFAPGVEGLPQGAPTSPYLFNLYCQEMDIELGALCENAGVTYTRWLDDFTFSSPKTERVFTDSFRKKIRDTIMRHGVKINHQKSRVHQRVTKPVTVTGLSIYPDGRIQPCPDLLTKLFNEMSEIEEQLDTLPTIGSEWELVSLQARLNGWNSVIELGEHTERGEDLPPILDRAKKIYRDLSHRAAWLLVHE